MTEYQRNEKRFAVFKAPEWGIRALCRLLVNYQAKHKLKTVRQIINRWAPPVENDTGAYVNAVAKAVGVGPDEPISVGDINTMRALATAIIAHENAGYRYPDEVMDKALRLAGVV